MMEEIKIRSDNRIPVGANIRRIRIEKKVKASSIVLDLQLKGCNINKQRYYKLEHDLANVYASELVAIANYLNVSLDELLKAK